ncbi:MAG: hypothetical protein RMJ44_05435 [Cytophagales bacterium]|nr:hypothetical protein [Bernardetiaceae bacterium]MDW8210509.1 hypothetical protein [Cytophagales bacterium]
MFLIFAVGFPLAYLLVGKTYILRQAIYELVTTYKIMLLEYLLRQILSYSQPKSAKWQQVFQKGSQWLAGTPFPIRWVITGLVESLPIGEVLQQVIQNQELSNENITQLSQLAAQKLSEHLNVELLEPSPYPLIILAAINLAAVTIEIAL